MPAAAPIEYSQGYKTRLKIHKIASFAMLPLFATELILGQSLYDDGGSGKKDAHVAVGVAIGTLFGINTVTGVWNLLESRKIRTAGRDASFTASSCSPPTPVLRRPRRWPRTPNTVAMTPAAPIARRPSPRSASVTAGYLMMLFTK